MMLYLASVVWLYLSSITTKFWLGDRMMRANINARLKLPDQLNNSDVPCITFWTTDLAPYRHGLELGQGAFMPLYSSLAASEQASREIKTAVVFVHGLSANANQ